MIKKIGKRDNAEIIDGRTIDFDFSFEIKTVLRIFWTPFPITIVTRIGTKTWSNPIKSKKFVNGFKKIVRITNDDIKVNNTDDDAILLNDCQSFVPRNIPRCLLTPIGKEKSEIEPKIIANAITAAIEPTTLVDVKFVASTQKINVTIDGITLEAYTEMMFPFIESFNTKVTEQYS